MYGFGRKPTVPVARYLVLRYEGAADNSVRTTADRWTALAEKLSHDEALAEAERLTLDRGGAYYVVKITHEFAAEETRHAVKREIHD